MDEYHKIKTVFKRDPENMRYVLEDEWATPEIEYLKENEWIWTEKVHGVNTRIMWQPQEMQPIRFGGKTDNAQMPLFLIDRLNEIFYYQKFIDAEFGTTTDDYMTLYGESYGAKIQKGGGNYRADGVDFVLFDVKIGDWWLRRKDVEDIAVKLGIKVVPIVGRGNLEDAVAYVKSRPESMWGEFPMEGIVAKPETELFDRSGERIVVKIKTRDF